LTGFPSQARLSAEGLAACSVISVADRGAFLALGRYAGAVLPLSHKKRRML
jgi:hypothetical protein